MVTIISSRRIVDIDVVIHFIEAYLLKKVLLVSSVFYVDIDGILRRHGGD